MSQKATILFLLLVISEYSNTETAYQAECLLFQLLNDCNEKELKEYEQCTLILETFNEVYMHKISGRHPVV